MLRRMRGQPRRIRVYIVEDSPLFIGAMADLLNEIGSVEIVGSAGEAALAAEEIARLNPDVVTLDIQLTAGTGLDVLKRVKANRENSTVAIIFSNLVENGVHRLCSELGADFIFDKSYDFGMLEEVLRSMQYVGGTETCRAAG